MEPQSPSTPPSNQSDPNFSPDTNSPAPALPQSNDPVQSSQSSVPQTVDPFVPTSSNSSGVADPTISPYSTSQPVVSSSAPGNPPPNVPSVLGGQGQPVTPEPFAAIDTPPAFQDLPKSRKKLFAVIGISVAVVLAATGVTLAYIGVIGPNKPENIWSSALNNTGKAYDELVGYANEVKNVKDWQYDGTFKLSGTIAADGTIQGKSSGDTSDMTATISAVGAKIGLDVRTFPSTNSTPDFYVRATGLQGLGTLLAADDPTYQQMLNGVNNHWYVIDHTLFDQAGIHTNSSTQISGDDIIALLKTWGTTNKKYLFTSDASRSVLTMKQKVGKETRNSRPVYHFKAGIRVDHLGPYIEQLCKDAKSSQIAKSLGDLENTYDCAKEAKNTVKDMAIKDSDTADVWVDTKTRLVHSIRFTDVKNKDNYLEIAQNFTGGNQVPMSLVLHDTESGETTDITTKLTYNKDTRKLQSNMDVKTASKDSDQNMSGTFGFNIQPSKDKVKVEKPTDAKTIIELMNDLGLGSMMSTAADYQYDTDNTDPTIQAKAPTTATVQLAHKMLEQVSKPGGTLR